MVHSRWICCMLRVELLEMVSPPSGGIEAFDKEGIGVVDILLGSEFP